MYYYFPSSFKFPFVILARLALLALVFPPCSSPQLPRRDPAPEGAAGRPRAACGGRRGRIRGVSRRRGDWPQQGLKGAGI